MKKIVLSVAVLAMFATSSCKKCVTCSDCGLLGSALEDKEICEKDYDNTDQYDAAVETAELVCSCK